MSYFLAPQINSFTVLVCSLKKQANISCSHILDKPYRIELLRSVGFQNGYTRFY